MAVHRSNKPTTKRNHTYLVLYFKQPKSRVTKINN